jgi:IMP dehydrogenase
MNNSVCFDDVLLVPQFSDITSRKDIELISCLDKNHRFRLPVISSPMDTVTGSKMARTMSDLGGLGIIHRYNTITDQVTMVEKALALEYPEGNEVVGVAVGVSGDYLERASLAARAGAKVICVDIAHGHHTLMRHALKTLRNTLGNSVHIMAGNVATLEAFNDLSDWGADSIRVGIGGGSICSTRLQTGHGMPTLQSVIDCSRSDRNTTLIADGGIRTSGDIVKALAAGADFAMLGSLLAGTEEAPGEAIYDKGERRKVYRGMASKDAQLEWRGHTASEEGVSSTVPYKGDLKNVLASLEKGIRSGLSYTGACNLVELRARSKFIKQSAAGQRESFTHIVLNDV